jgi:hypothetical protein
MSIATVIDALCLPHGARVDKRVPKKLLLEQGAPSSTDKRQIQDGIEEVHWVAALKPTNIGVQEYRDEVREYQEIAVLAVNLRPAAKAARISQLIHRAIPYPVLLITKQAEAVSLSLAHKRWSQGESGKVVIEELRRTASFCAVTPDPAEAQFLASLALSTLPSSNLFALYQGWFDRVVALEAALITGLFAPPDSIEGSAALHDGVQNHTSLQYELSTLRARAAKEKQLNRRVELNTEIKRLESRLAAITQELTMRERR